jgi:Uma2 family endonuclease
MTPTRLLTFAEFAELPDPPGGKYELRHGELAFMAPPKHQHYRIQTRLQGMLQTAAGASWVSGIEMPFRPSREYEFWFANVALLRRERFDRTDADGNIEGSPELVAEVWSPSNRVSEMLDRGNACLKGGAREFWLVDPERSSVEVYSADGKRPELYGIGDEIALFTGGTLRVSEIFQ